jgi:hypothetical protein
VTAFIEATSSREHCWAVKFDGSNNVKKTLSWLELDAHLVKDDKFNHPPPSPMYRAELGVIFDNGKEFKAHMARHVNQNTYKKYVVDNILISPTNCYIFIDFWAKLSSHLKAVATCESFGKGISVLGTMCIYKNPSLDERDYYTRKFGAIDFSGLPPPPEKDGPDHVVEFINLYNKNSNQCAFHSSSTLGAFAIILQREALV